MSRLADTKWEFVKYHDTTSMMLGYIRCTILHRGLQYDYNFAISKDYAAMRQSYKYFWYVLAGMARELDTCLT